MHSRRWPAPVSLLSALFSALFSTLFSTLAACSTPFPAWQLMPAGTAGRALPGEFTGPLGPARVRARMVIDARGMELELDFLALVRPPTEQSPGALRIQAFDPISGGTAFHVVHVVHAAAESAPRQTEIVQQNRALPTAMLRDGLIEDLATWWFLTADPGDRLVRHAGGPAPGQLGWLREAKNAAGTTQLAWSSSPGHPIDRVATGRAGRLWAEFELEWHNGQPAAGQIRNHRFGYTVDLTVLEWQPASLSDHRFR